MPTGSRYLGKPLGAPGQALPPSQVSVDSAPMPAPAAKADYSVEHADAVSDAAARSAAEGVAKTAQNAQTVAQTGASPVVGIASDLAVNAHVASAGVAQDAPIVEGPVAHNRRLVAGAQATLGPVSASASVRAPRRAGAWLGWVVGGLAIGGLIYMMAQPAERRSRRSEE